MWHLPLSDATQEYIVVFIAMVWAILFPSVGLPACDLVVQHVHAVGEDVSVVSHIA